MNNWSVIATAGTGIGQVFQPSALAVDTAGNLYVAEGGYDDYFGDNSRIQKRAAQGNWSILDAPGVGALAADGAGNLYVADTGHDRVQEYMPGP
jgi:hypothetical protein